MGQDYDKDLYIVLTGTGTTTIKNFVDNVEDYIFGDRDEREASILMPYTKNLSNSLSRVLNEWAIGDGDEPNYPLHAYVEPDAGHKSVAKAVTSSMAEERGVTMSSGALETAMSDLVERQKAGNEVVVVVVYNEDEDVKLVGELKNYQSIPVLNLDGMIDSFPGFKTTDEILKEEREREEFETKEAIRIAAEKEQEKLAKAAAAPAKKAAAPRKRAAAKAPAEKPLTDKPAAKKAAAPRKATAPKPVVEEPKEEKEYKVGDVVEVGGSPFVKHSELPEGLEPVRPQPKPTVEEYKALVASGALVPEDLPSPEEVPDLWKDVSRAQAAVSVPDGKLVVSKESMAQLGEGIKEMSQAYAKTIDALTDMLREGK